MTRLAPSNRNTRRVVVALACGAGLVISYALVSGTWAFLGVVAMWVVAAALTVVGLAASRRRGPAAYADCSSE
jgi:uncharacterized membrane protein